jgi:hypothetical protein
LDGTLLQEIDSVWFREEPSDPKIWLERPIVEVKIWLEKLIIGAKIWLERPILPPPPGVFGKECAAATKERGCGKL